MRDTSAPSGKAAPTAYRLLNAASHAPQTREYLLKLAGLHFRPTSALVRDWQDALFDRLVIDRHLLRHPDGCYSLTRPGEDRLSRYFADFGPCPLCRAV